MNSADAPTRLGAREAADVANVWLDTNSLGRRRASVAAVSLTSGPTATIYQLVRFQPGTDSSASELFAFSGTTPALHRLASGTWSSVTLSDTVNSFAATGRPQAVTHRGKLFIAYDSNVNRLHVYDPNISTSLLRRVGIGASAAATVANTGSGSYAATLRYYKIQYLLIDGSSVTIATSELSDAVSFTPSGSGTAARITLPTAPDSATHWKVFGSSDNVTYYSISSATVIATTTYDDSAAPSQYSTGTLAPTVGLNIPPPSAKYLLSDGNRLLMAGAWEISAPPISGPLTTSTLPVGQSRVWYTDLPTARDNTGEDESVPNTTDFKAYVDCGENDGDTIVGLSGPLYGVVYVFKQRSIWQLVPTNIATAPYQALRLTNSVGATWQDAIALGETGSGQPAIYFMSLTGPKRIGSGGQIEDIGADLRDTTASTYSSISSTPVVVWDQVRRMCWWIAYQGTAAYAFQPQFETTSPDGVRGGWTRHVLSLGSGTTIACAALRELSSVMALHFGGEVTSGNTAKLGTLSGAAATDAAAVTFTPSATSPIVQVAGPLRKTAFGHPVIEWTYPGAATAISVSVASAIGGPLAVTGTVTDTTTSSTYTQSVVQEKLESIALADAYGIQITVTWDTAVDGTQRPRINSVVVPVLTQEAT